MPFNEKGEFIRPPAEPVQPSRVRITSSDDRPAPGRPQRQRSASSTDGWEILAGVLLIVAAITALAGLIWVVVVFQRWILIGLGLWAVSSIRRWFR